MKTWLLVLVILPIIEMNAIGLTQSQVRWLYKKAAVDESSCKKLISHLQTYNEGNNPVLGGYKACATMMMANYVINPLSKLNHFSTGKSLLEKCIISDKENIELRFLRFAVQTKAPTFLGYNVSIFDDKEFLMSALNKIGDLELKQIIIGFLKDSEYLSAKEKQSLRN